ncbi:VOC family protein [Streptomyces viridochromogenes]|uniref:VOC family protein n=1 Tax=Streptomyces viridochromogenes TaxID=1938 RepID=UPI0002F00EA9
MVSVVQNVAIDCSNAYEPARFWSEVTGCPLPPQDRTGDRETQVMLPEGPLPYFTGGPAAHPPSIRWAPSPASTRWRAGLTAGGAAAARA